MCVNVNLKAKERDRRNMPIPVVFVVVDDWERVCAYLCVQVFLSFRTIDRSVDHPPMEVAVQ